MPVVKFGRLTFIRREGKKALCKCDCGVTKWFTFHNLGRCTHSCGCLRRQLVSEKNTKHGQTKGSESKSSRFSREYVAWRKMRQRCLDPNCPQYPYYGGRGISITPRWDDFETFLKDVGNKPSLSHSLDRYPDMNGNYEPDNVRWATKEEQANNMRSNVRLTLDGETLTLKEWSERLQIKKGTIQARLNVGWSIEKTLTTPLGPTSGKAARS